MNRNRLKGTEGDKLNALLSGKAYNFSKLLKDISALLRPFFVWLLERCQAQLMVT